jgi:hypothetical protein
MSYLVSYSDVLVSVLKACDTALEYVVRLGKSKKSVARQLHVNEEFQKAIRKLQEYEKKLPAK